MNNNSSSWEEIAFAEDAAGALGGCVWPPRSYSCSFCRREFRSAQALGGHMNIHRRDRARLKQIPVESVRTNHLHTDLNCTSFDDPPLSFVYRSPNNPEFTSPLVSSIPSHAAIGVSRSASENTSSGLCFLATGFGKKRKDRAVPSQFSSWSSFASGKSTHQNRVLEVNQNKKSASVLEPDDQTRLETAKGLSESLNLAVCCKTQWNYASNVEEAASCNKRRRVEATSPAGIFERLSTSMERCLSQSEPAFKHCSGATEGLDLELRLGNAPKVK